jgi:hypothetical protein
MPDWLQTTSPVSASKARSTPRLSAAYTFVPSGEIVGLVPLPPPMLAAKAIWTAPSTMSRP